MPSNIIDINPSDPDTRHIFAARDAIVSGGVIIFPTCCLYGLGADPFTPDAVERVFNIKKRAQDNPILLLVKNQAMVKDLAQEVPDIAEKLMEKFWPGRLTIVFHANKRVPKPLTAGTGKIGLRLPINKVSTAIIQKLGTPITGTSANISGDPSCADISELPDEVTEKTDLILNAGQLKGGSGSTVIDITKTPPVILREGEVNAKDIFEFLEKETTF